jgi:Putative phage integrase
MTNSDFDLKYFESPVTKRKVALNLHPDNFAWLYVPTNAEFEAVLKEHERIRIEQVWTEWAEPREGDTWIAAFREAAPSVKSGLRFVATRAFAARARFERSRGLGGELRALPLDEQRRLFKSCMPVSYEELEPLLTPVGLQYAYNADIRASFLAVGDVRKFVQQMCAYAARKSRPREQYTLGERYVEILVMLRARGWLLFSTGFIDWSLNLRWRAASNRAYGGHIAKLLEEVSSNLDHGQSDYTPPHVRFGAAAVLASSMAELSDMSAHFIDEMETICVRWAKTAGRDGTGLAGAARHELRLGRALRTLWNHRHPELPLANKPHHNRKAIRKTDGSFEWMTTARPELIAWAETLAAFVKQRTGSVSKVALISALNFFGEYLVALPAPPLSPEQVDRRLHIHDVTLKNTATYMQKLAAWSSEPKRRNLYLGYLSEFFDWVRDWLAATGKTTEASHFQNPVSTQDRFEGGDTPGQSFRTALPSWLLKELRTTILEDDFAFFREDGRQDWVTVYDRELGKTSREWWPGTAVCLLVLLHLPLRSHQARWLDSGVLDEFTVDPATGKRERNTHVGAVPGRNEGFARLLHDTLRQESWCGLFVNTNKTAVYNGPKRGYEIPYLPAELSELLERVRAWGLRYLPPLAKPIVYAESGEGRHAYPDVDVANVPHVAPLFRDPSTLDKAAPVAYARLTRAYVRVLVKTEQRIKEKYGVDIALTAPKANGKGRVWKYDLHTLRVSGISAMIENGVPLEVVSQFVAGHASLVMTLWYLKSSPGKMREFIAVAHDKAAAEGDFVGSNAFLDNIEKFSAFLLSKNGDQRGDNGDPAFTAMKTNSGLWTISTDGICPGTACSDGGELDSTTERHGPVPGGRRCGLCRFWITGPAFILGQVAQANNLIYQIRRNGEELAVARDQLIEETDAGRKAAAAHTRSRIEGLERELTLDIAEWQARYAFAMASSGLLDEYVEARSRVVPSDKLPAPLLTPSSSEDLKVTLQESNEFILLDHVTQMVDFMPGFKNREAMHEKHLMLAKVLDANELPQFMLKLDAKQAEDAGNLMADLLLQYVKGQDLTKVLSGELKLADIPALHDEVQQLAGVTAKTNLVSSRRKFIPIEEV